MYSSRTLTSLSFGPGASEQIYADLKPAFDFYHPLATPYLRLLVTSAPHARPETLKLEPDLTDPSSTDFVVWGVDQIACDAYVEKYLETLSGEELNKALGSIGRGYHVAKEFDFRIPLLAVDSRSYAFLPSRMLVTYDDSEGYSLESQEEMLKSSWGFKGKALLGFPKLFSIPEID